jgi:hypothetical protein
MTPEQQQKKQVRAVRLRLLLLEHGDDIIQRCCHGILSKHEVISALLLCDGNVKKLDRLWRRWLRTDSGLLRSHNPTLNFVKYVKLSTSQKRRRARQIAIP